MPDYVSISYRGATYALGQGPQFYGIWHAAALQAQPLEQWPLTPEGWTAAWSRFASVEVPGTITAVTRAAAPAPVPWDARTGADPAAATRKARIAAALVGVGVVLGLIGLFPAYIASASIASQSFNVVPHVIYLAAWTLSAVLILSGGVRMRAGALFGLGTSAVTLGLFVADAGTAASAGGQGSDTGLVLTILSWVGCTAGVALAVVAGRAVRTGLGPVPRFAGLRASRPGHDIVPLVTLVLAAVGAAIAFAPSWDRFTLHTASGATQAVTAGNAFANPGPVIFGDVLAMVTIVAVVVVAALWRQLRLGAALALGAAVPMVAQAISAIIQIGQPASPQEFGITPAQASQLGLTIDSGLTAMFWVYCAFVGTLILLCIWMLVAHEPAVGGTVRPATAAPLPGGPVPGGPAGDLGGPGEAAPAGGPTAQGPEGDGPEPDTAAARGPWSGGSSA